MSTNIPFYDLYGEAFIRKEPSLVHAEDIAYALGFKDSGYFSRFFKRWVGVGAGIFRQQADIS